MQLQALRLIPFIWGWHPWALCVIRNFIRCFYVWTDKPPMYMKFELITSFTSRNSNERQQLVRHLQFILPPFTWQKVITEKVGQNWAFHSLKKQKKKKNTEIRTSEQIVNNGVEHRNKSLTVQKFHVFDLNNIYFRHNGRMYKIDTEM